MDYTYHILNFEFPKEHSPADYWEFSILLDGEVFHYLNGKREIYQKNTLYYLTTKDYHYLLNKSKKKHSLFKYSRQRKTVTASTRRNVPYVCRFFIKGTTRLSIT